MKFDFKEIKAKTKEAFADMGRGAKVIGRKCMNIYHECPLEVFSGVTALVSLAYLKGTLDGYDAGGSHAAQVIGESMAHAITKTAELEGTETETEVPSEN